MLKQEHILSNAGLATRSGRSTTMQASQDITESPSSPSYIKQVQSVLNSLTGPQA